MITTMMGVITVIIILVLLMILVLKMTKKYHTTWYWQHGGKKGKKNRARPPPLFGQCPKEIHFLLWEVFPNKRNACVFYSCLWVSLHLWHVNVETSSWFDFLPCSPLLQRMRTIVDNSTTGKERALQRSSCLMCERNGNLSCKSGKFSTMKTTAVACVKLWNRPAPVFIVVL